MPLPATSSTLPGPQGAPFVDATIWLPLHAPESLPTTHRSREEPLQSARRVSWASPLVTWGRGKGLPVAPAQPTGARPKERSAGNERRYKCQAPITTPGVPADHWGQYQAPGSSITWGQETGPAGLRQWGQCKAPASSMTWQVGKSTEARKSPPPGLPHPSYRREPPWPAPAMVRLSPPQVPLAAEGRRQVQKPEVVRLSWAATPSWQKTATPVPYVPLGVSGDAPHYSPGMTMQGPRPNSQGARWHP